MIEPTEADKAAARDLLGNLRGYDPGAVCSDWRVAHSRDVAWLAARLVETREAGRASLAAEFLDVRKRAIIEALAIVERLGSPTHSDDSAAQIREELLALLDGAGVGSREDDTGVSMGTRGAPDCSSCHGTGWDIIGAPGHRRRVACDCSDHGERG
jgi:hypothetical protein